MLCPTAQSRRSYWRGFDDESLFSEVCGMNKINKIEIEGFRSIKDINFELADINVLIGANGSGKSNFVGAFSFLRAITEGRLENYVRKSGGANRILHFGTKNTSKVRLRVHFNNSKDQYEIKLAPTVSDELFVDDEWVYFRNKSYPSPYGEGLQPLGKEAGISGSVGKGIASYVKSALKSWRVYHFHDTGDSSPMKKTSEVDDNRFLRQDGANLSAFLYLLKNNYPDSYRQIRQVFKQVAPFFDDFLLEPRELDEQRIMLEWLHKSSEAYFDASSLSDGSLRFACLATLLCQPREFLPSVILLDEPELGLHPFAITLLGAMIKSVANHSQVVLSTQSSLLLDQFEVGQVVVVEQGKAETKMRRLDEASLQDWLSSYSLGQLWEKNELGGRPGVGPS